ncbi:MAG TPA: gluconate 2-dehydrogenase subunit 3 family protein [Longimicrobiales bacterium]|nr:gluconate 2-dehydrogenase subunit 3 family protein [Longimicrobiales bacterium]
MSDFTRRDTLKVLGAAGLAAAVPRPLRADLPPEIRRAAVAAEQALLLGDYDPVFFTPAEWRTVRLLADMIIPRDGRSGSATDAGVPEFIDFTVNDRPAMQTPVRGGLAWLDAESRERFGAAFADGPAPARAALLDAIAWPERASPDVKAGVAFFNRFRDLVASGFYTSRIGIADVQYMGNAYVPQWNGCPPEACRHLGVSYGEG